MPKKPHGKNLEAWEHKGWKPREIPAGRAISDPIPFNVATQDISVLGQVFGADGEAIHGRERPHFTVVDGTGGATINLVNTFNQLLTFLYKIEDALVAEAPKVVEAPKPTYEAPKPKAASEHKS